MYRIIFAALVLTIGQVKGSDRELTATQTETVSSATIDRELRMLDLRYKYQSFLKEWQTTKQAAWLGRIVSAGLAATYAPLYSYRAIDIFSEYRRPAFEKITTALYYAAFASLVLFLAHQANAIGNEQLMLEKQTIIPKLTALQLMLEDEFQNDDSEDAKTLLNDIKRTLAQLAG